MKINGKEYILPVILPSTMRKLEKRGLVLDKVEERPLSAAVAFLSLCVGSTKKAEALLDKYVVDGGDMGAIYSEITDAVNSSPMMRQMGGNGDGD